MGCKQNRVWTSPPQILEITKKNKKTISYPAAWDESLNNLYNFLDDFLTSGFKYKYSFYS